MRIASCSSCRADIVWLTTSNGKKMPVDVDSLGLDLDEIAELDDDAEFEYGVHASHFDSCKFADRHRRMR